ncbi:uncharacterized protein [Dysidea avara]|uniref:uncharacterized protein n=1 Tax=Dysidea avara TaxID=196820 RepID=UPI00331FCDC2
MLLPFLLIAVSSLLTTASCTVTPEDCESVAERFTIPRNFRQIFEIQDGSSLSTCPINGQQCCSPLLIQLFTRSIDSFINTDTFGFAASGLANAEDAVDQLRNETDAIIMDITENTVRPLLLSAVSPPTDNFTAAVDTTVSGITAALNGNSVDLKQTLYNYVRAVATQRLDEVLGSVDLGFGFKIVITLTEEQKECAVQFGFNHLYNNTDAAAELVSLLQNISTAVGVIKQLPPIFDELLANFKEFRFSKTCVDVLTSNFLCPMCVNQPLMCPGRCSEIVIGCLSPLNQAVVQLDTSLRLIFSIIKALAGFPDRSTDFVDVNRIPILYDSLSDALQEFDYEDPDLIRNILQTCDIQLSQFFGKRSMNEYHQMKNKRDITIPEVKINQSLFENLEEYFSSVAGDELTSAIEELCSPNFSIPVSTFEMKIVSENGMCSYGVGNVGSYNNTFTRTDVLDQAYNNPAGYYNYTELIDQANTQTYVLTRLFDKTDIPESVFSVFLPDETLPTTNFLFVKPPTNPNPPPLPPPMITGPSSSPTDSDVTLSSSDDSADSRASLLSYSLMVVWGCGIAGLLYSDMI